MLKYLGKMDSWRSGSAPRSHRGGQRFEPSRVHPHFMKIVFLCRFSASRIGGVETHVKEVTAGLEKKKHTVNIISSIKYPQIKFLGLLVVWWQLLKRIKVIKKADIIHIHDVFIWYLPFRFIFPQKPVFITFHGYETKFPPSSRAIIIRKISEKLSWGNICVGDYIKKWYGTKPSYTIYGGVSKIQNSKVKMQKYNSKFKILFIGRLEKDTGVITYLKTLEILKKKGIKFVFEACGDGQLRSEVEKIGQVHGFVKDISSYLTRSDLVFSSSYLSILEALANKKMVLAVYDNPLKKDYLELSPFAKFIEISDNPREIARKIMRLSGDHNDGYQWVKKQTWERLVYIYEKFYRSHGLE